MRETAESGSRSTWFPMGFPTGAPAGTTPAAVVIATAFALLASAAGCGKTGSSDADAGTAAASCAALASARCALRSMCSSATGGATATTAAVGASVIRTYGDMQTCVAQETLACTSSLAAPDTGWTIAGIDKCVSAFATYSCQDFFDNNPPGDCAPKGSRANGAECTFNAQCASAYCQGTKSDVCGTCADPPGAGADCSDSTCGHNQTCLTSMDTCAAVVSMNGACDGTHPCDNALACVGATATAMGTCRPAAATIGASCGGTMPGCDTTLGLYCAGSAGAKTCTAMTFAHDGQPCGLLSDGSRVGCVAGECYTATGTAGSGDMGACKASVGAPAACDTVLGPSCLAPARCVVPDNGSAGTCATPDATMCSST